MSLSIAPIVPTRVLIVDDDDEVRGALEDYLKFGGFDACSVGNGEEALSWLHSQAATPCVVLLDLMMPVMDGRAFLSRKVKDHLLRDLPVIVLTAGEDCREAARLEGATLCFPKTVALERLVGAIYACDARNRKERPLQRKSA